MRTHAHAGDMAGIAPHLSRATLSCEAVHRVEEGRRAGAGVGVRLATRLGVSCTAEARASTPSARKAPQQTPRLSRSHAQSAELKADTSLHTEEREWTPMRTKRRGMDKSNRADARYTCTRGARSHPSTAPRLARANMYVQRCRPGRDHLGRAEMCMPRRRVQSLSVCKHKAAKAAHTGEVAARDPQATASRGRHTHPRALGRT